MRLYPAAVANERMAAGFSKHYTHNKTMDKEERKKLVSQIEALREKIRQSDCPTPSDLRELQTLKSILLTESKNESLRISESGPKSSFFSKKSMSGFTNRRRK